MDGGYSMNNVNFNPTSFTVSKEHLDYLDSIIVPITKETGHRPPSRSMALRLLIEFGQKMAEHHGKEKFVKHICKDFEKN